MAYAHVFTQPAPAAPPTSALPGLALAVEPMPEPGRATPVAGPTVGELLLYCLAEVLPTKASMTQVNQRRRLEWLNRELGPLPLTA